MVKESSMYDCSNENDVVLIAELYPDPGMVKEFIMRNCTNDGVTYWKHEELLAYLEANGFMTIEETAAV